MGVGATRTLAGVNGGTFVYDTGAFHIVGLLGFLNIDQPQGQSDFSVFALGGQFLYHVHDTAQSDFSLGGGLTLVTVGDDNNNDITNIDIEGLAQIRAFIVPNVALSASLGLLIVVGDEDGLVLGDAIVINGPDNGQDNAIALGGQVNASFGMTYFF
jgi:hypothetical protein